MNEQYQELIDRYVMGSMSAHEQKAFEQEIKNNEDLRELVVFTQRMRRLLSEQEERLKILKQLEVGKHSFIQDNRNWITGVVSLAAVVVISFIAFSPFSNSEPGSGKEKEIAVLNNIGKEDGNSISDLIKKGKNEQALAMIEKQEQKIKHGKAKRETTKSHMEPEDQKKQSEKLGRNIPTENNVVLSSQLDDQGIPGIDVEKTLTSNRQEIPIDEIELKWLKVCALLALDKKDEVIPLLEELRKTNGKFRLKADSMYNTLKE